MPPASLVSEVAELIETVRRSESDGDAAFVITHPELDAVALASAAGTASPRMTFAVHVRLDGTHPWLVARAMTSLDHLLGGRTALVPDPGTLSESAIDDFLTAVAGLWDSWDPAAEMLDEPGGRFADASLVRPVHHDGPVYRSRGPLNLPHAPQSRLPVWALSGDRAVRRADAVVPEEATRSLRAGRCVALAEFPREGAR